MDAATTPEPRVPRTLGELESVVMQRLWAWGRPATVREVRDDLACDRDLAYTTVMTVLDNLHGKELVVRVKEGRAYVYSARLSREEYTAGLLEQVLDDGGDRGTALLHFVGRMSASEVSALRDALVNFDNEHDAPGARADGATSRPAGVR